MGRITPGITVVRAVVGVVAIATLSIGFFTPPAFAVHCKTEYRTECVAWDSAGKCTNFERVSVEVCVGDHILNVSPPSPPDCYECFEWYDSGTCKKTKKVAC